VFIGLEMLRSILPIVESGRYYGACSRNGGMNQKPRIRVSSLSNL